MGLSWPFMRFRRISWYCHGLPWDFMALSWASVEFHWSSMGLPKGIISRAAHTIVEAHDLAFA